MPTDPSSFSTRSGQPPADPVPGERGSTTSGIRRQAREIINAVLSDPSPGQARARDLLREHLAAHPGNPEKALAEHLMALRSLTWSPRGSAGLLQPVPSGGDHGETAGAEAVSRIRAVLNDGLLLTAFQPISDLAAGGIIGAEALTRIVSDGNDTAGWFAEAALVGLESELEFAALESALRVAHQLAEPLYVALKVSSATCLNPLLPELLRASDLSPERIVLQLSEALAPGRPAALVAALAPLRRSGVRLAVGQIGLYPESVPHLRELGPDIIKLDRGLVAGIDTDPLRPAFGSALTGFAAQLGATVIAEGIETGEELAAVAGMGVRAGQGYFLGRPSTRPQDWAGWNLTAASLPSPAGSLGAAGGSNC